nr:response regulator [Dongshaea marina]
MRPQVLVCDDSGMARKQLARCLPPDWEVDINFATNGVEGVEAILSGKGEIVFLDLTMPELDGYGVLETLKKEQVKAQVFVVSGDIQPEAVQRVKGLGAQDFIKKPASKETLQNLLVEHRLYSEGGAVPGKTKAAPLRRQSPRKPSSRGQPRRSGTVTKRSRMSPWARPQICWPVCSKSTSSCQSPMSIFLR